MAEPVFGTGRDVLAQRPCFLPPITLYGEVVIGWSAVPEDDDWEGLVRRLTPLCIKLNVVEWVSVVRLVLVEQAEGGSHDEPDFRFLHALLNPKGLPNGSVLHRSGSLSSCLPHRIRKSRSPMLR